MLRPSLLRVRPLPPPLRLLSPPLLAPVPRPALPPTRKRRQRRLRASPVASRASVPRSSVDFSARRTRSLRLRLMLLRPRLRSRRTRLLFPTLARFLLPPLSSPPTSLRSMRSSRLRLPLSLLRPLRRLNLLRRLPQSLPRRSPSQPSVAPSSVSSTSSAVLPTRRRRTSLLHLLFLPRMLRLLLTPSPLRRPKSVLPLPHLLSLSP